MPRCLMAKKWKAYPWPERPPPDDEEEEIDVVGDSSAVAVGPCWGPSSPTAGATAPSPPPTSPHGTTLLYNGYLQELSPASYTTTFIQRGDQQVNVQSHQPSYATLRTVTESQELGECNSSHNSNHTITPIRNRKSLAMCFTSTGAALSLPPKKKDIYRPYSLDDRPPPPVLSRVPAEEDLHAAHAILDLSASTTVFMPPPPPTQQLPIVEHHPEPISSSSLASPPSPPPPPPPPPPPQPSLPATTTVVPVGLSSAEMSPSSAYHQNQPGSKTVAYTYEAFFVSDGRSKKRIGGEETAAVTPHHAPVINEKQKYTCSECGKQYATSSNLSRHKQTHRSLDSQAAKKCMTCGKAYVSMPALAMHVLTHKLLHKCGVCGKQFSRPWLLQGHLRSHTGEKPYGCAHCGKAFADRSNLRAHMQTHSSDKNFECPRCHKSFALKSYLNKHLESACLKEDGGGEDGARVVCPESVRVHAG